MTLFNRNWIGFAGDPLTGKTPTQTIVHADQGVVLTGQQQGAVAHAYKLFCDAITVSSFPGGYHVQNRTFVDGTRVRMTSIAGVHQVHVWPPGGWEGGVRIPHGLAVVANWGSRLIYKFNGLSWSPDASAGVPQVPRDPVEAVGYNQVAKFPGGRENFILPLVFSAGGKTLWDYARHGAETVSGQGPRSQKYYVPINMKYTVDGVPVNRPHEAHLTVDGQITRTFKAVDPDHPLVAPSIKVLYSMAETDALLVDPEDPYWLAGSSDSIGASVALQIYREAQTNPTFAPHVWAVRFGNERLTRTGKETYALAERNVVTIWTPTQAQTHVVSDVSNLDIGEESMGIGAIEFSGGAQVNYDIYDGHPNPSDPAHSASDYRHGYAESVRIDHTAAMSAAMLTSEYAMRRAVELGVGDPEVIDKVVALPAHDTVEYAKLELSMYYPSTAFWRGGTKSAGVSEGSFGLSRTSIGTFGNTIERRDAEHLISAAPYAKIVLPWADIKIFEGVVSGEVRGRLHADTPRYSKQTVGSLMYCDFVVAGPQYTVYLGSSNRDYYMEQANMLPAWQAEFNAYPLAVNSSSEVRVVTVDEPLVNTGSYTFKSRHIIDYDHRARFCAALRVEVECAGATWVQGPVYVGGTMPSVSPSYVVKIYFECQWDAPGGMVTDETHLVTKTCTRPAFEFPTKNAPFNVFIYPGNETDKPLNYCVPPEPKMPKDYIESFVALTRHQGVNDHLAAQDYWFDPPLDAQSKTGIEFSYVQGGKEIPHNKYARGQIYARTFKLGEINQALWLLPTLMMDAPENNFRPLDAEWTPWFYIPELKDVIYNTVFHVEVRNGVIGNWSDDIPMAKSGFPPTFAPHPLPTDRDIKLYRV